MYILKDNKRIILSKKRDKEESVDLFVKRANPKKQCPKETQRVSGSFKFNLPKSIIQK